MADGLTTIIDNSDKILEEFNKQIENGLKAIGLKAEGHAKGECPVDSGRLRNSITFATNSYHSPGNTNKPPKSLLKSPPQDAEPKDYALLGTPEKASVYIGTNVEYAERIENRDSAHTTGRAHFLKNAASNHGDEYRKTMEAALKK